MCANNHNNNSHNFNVIGKRSSLTLPQECFKILYRMDFFTLNRMETRNTLSTTINTKYKYIRVDRVYFCNIRGLSSEYVHALARNWWLFDILSQCMPPYWFQLSQEEQLMRHIQCTMSRCASGCVPSNRAHERIRTRYTAISMHTVIRNMFTLHVSTTHVSIELESVGLDANVLILSDRSIDRRKFRLIAERPLGNVLLTALWLRVVWSHYGECRDNKIETESPVPS